MIHHQMQPPRGGSWPVAALHVQWAYF